jgi:predicted ribosome quality control (RQC) complex YloA/Tae2 family protein
MKEFSKQDIEDYDSLLYIKADTKRLKAIEIVKGKRKVLLNKEREVRKTNAGGMAKKKFRRHFEHVKKRTSTWHLENLEKLDREKYDKLKLEIVNEKYKTNILNFIKKRITNKKWFERFRYFIKKDTLIVGGKSRSSNEELLKNYLDKEDLVFHTQARGSPFFLIKGGNRAYLEFTSTATAFYSKEWKNTKKDIEVMYVKGNQIYKDKGMNSGTFGVRNDKNVLIIKKKNIESFKRD